MPKISCWIAKDWLEEKITVIPRARIRIIGIIMLLRHCERKRGNLRSELIPIRLGLLRHYMISQ